MVKVSSIIILSSTDHLDVISSIDIEGVTFSVRDKETASVECIFEIDRGANVDTDVNVLAGRELKRYARGLSVALKSGIVSARIEMIGRNHILEISGSLVFTSISRPDPKRLSAQIIAAADYDGPGLDAIDIYSQAIAAGHTYAKFWLLYTALQVAPVEIFPLDYQGYEERRRIDETLVGRYSDDVIYSDYGGKNISIITAIRDTFSHRTGTFSGAELEIDKHIDRAIYVLQEESERIIRILLNNSYDLGGIHIERVERTINPHRGV